MTERLIVYAKDLRSGSTLPFIPSLQWRGNKKNDSPHPLTGGLAEAKRRGSEKLPQDSRKNLFFREAAGCYHFTYIKNPHSVLVLDLPHGVF